MRKFFYKEPSFKYDIDGNMEIINKMCVGPIEVIIYGINKDGKFYFDWTYPDFYPDDSELEREYKIISKEEMIEKIKIEISICEKEGNNDLVQKYYKAIEMIENNNY